MQTTESDEIRTTRSGRSGWNWLLWIPIVIPLLSFFFNSDRPRLLGFPFFYWFQLACAVLSMVAIAVVHRRTKGDR